MLTALDDFEIDKFIEVVNELYKSAEILGAISRLIFFALLKKLGMNAWASLNNQLDDPHN